jgi:hypothetical protein
LLELRPVLRSVVDAEDFNRMLRDLVHKDVWPAGKNHFACLLYGLPGPAV